MFQDFTNLDLKTLPKLQIFKACESYIPSLALEMIIRNSHENLCIIELSCRLSNDEPTILLEQVTLIFLFKIVEVDWYLINQMFKLYLFFIINMMKLYSGQYKHWIKIY